MVSQLGKGFKGSVSLLKSARQYFCNIFRSLWEEICSKTCDLEVFQIFSLFVNILRRNDKYTLLVEATA